MKKSVRIPLFLLFIFAGSVLSLQAQRPDRLSRKHNLALTLQSSRPLRDFQVQIPQPVGCLHLRYHHRIKATPFSIGGEIFFGNLAEEQWEAYYNNETPDRLWALYTRSSDMAGIDFLGRYDFKRWKFLYPYAELKIGQNIFVTTETVEDPTVKKKKHAQLQEKTLLRDNTPNLGLSLGVQAPLFYWEKAEGKGLGLDLSLSYLAGGEASYMLDQPWRTVSSHTPMLLWRFGFQAWL